LWVQRNTNKEDRAWMRNHADKKLDACKNSLVKKTPPTANIKKKYKAGQSQNLFEEMKNESST
jgi:hypothetical protein